MNTDRTVLPHRFRDLRLVLLALPFLFIAAAFAAEAPKVKFDIPAGKAGQTLWEFAHQAKREIMFPVQSVGAVKTPAVQGELTVKEALDQLLAGTELTAFEDPKTGAIAVKRNPVPNDQRVAQEAATTQDNGSKGEEGKAVVLDKFVVNDQKIDGLNNKGLLQGGANAALYHDVVTRVDIERLGISSLEELFRYIPQTSSVTTFMQGPASNPSYTGGLRNRTSTIGLRGFDSSQTVVLINGRALPRSSLSPDGGADISRIPIAAIERVEILPYSGSAIYGAGAIGGAINIILRKDYSGRDLTTYIGTSTDGGATEYRFTYLEGLTANHGKTNITYTVSYQHRDPLRASQRGYLAEALKRYGPNSTAVDAQGVRLFESLILPAYASSPGTILIADNAASPTDGLGIPGATGARYAAIPVGTTAAGSAALTPASFTATAGQANLSPRYNRSLLYEPIDAYSFNAQVEHEFVKDKLSAYGEFTAGYNRKDYSAPQGLVVTLAADDPLNPFRTNVTPGYVGHQVNVFVDTPDLPDPSIRYLDQSGRVVAGFKGRINERWEWSVDGVLDYTHSTVDSNNPTTNMMDLVALSPYTATPDQQASPDVRRAIYALLADHNKYPISGADAAKYFNNIRHSASHGLQSEGNARLMGEVVTLPAGPLRASAVGKYQNWNFVSGEYYSGSDAESQLINGTPLDPALSGTPGSRRIWEGALELNVPIIGGKWRPVPIESFEIEGSASREHDTSSSINSDNLPFTNKQSASSSVIAGKLQVTKDVAFRASYSEGFYPPDWGAVGSPTSNFTIPGFFPDPKRGNTMQFTPVMTILQGGNPNLKPETAKSENYGVILTPRFLPGLTFNVDYWKIKKVDAVVDRSFTDIIANPDAFGFLITRQAPDATDPAGWLGRITKVDARAFNASVVQTEGFDLRARYSLDTTTLGRFDFTSSASFTNNYLISATPTAPVVDDAGGSGPVRWRGNGSLTWSKNRWSFTVTSRYVGTRSTPTTAPSASYPSASGVDGERLPSILRWDLQASYEIPYQITKFRAWKSWFAGTKWTLGVLNVLNTTPSFVSDGYSFYNSADDPRQRYLYVEIKKSF